MKGTLSLSGVGNPIFSEKRDEERFAITISAQIAHPKSVQDDCDLVANSQIRSIRYLHQPCNATLELAFLLPQIVMALV